MALWSILLLMNFSAVAADWVPLGLDSQGNSWHLDIASMVKEGNTVTAWKQIEFKQPYPETMKGSRIKKGFLLNITDCTQGETRVKSIGFLDPEGAIIELLDSGERIFQLPSSIHVALLRKALDLLCTVNGTRR